MDDSELLWTLVGAIIAFVFMFVLWWAGLPRKYKRR